PTSVSLVSTEARLVVTITASALLIGNYVASRREDKRWQREAAEGMPPGSTAGFSRSGKARKPWVNLYHPDRPDERRLHLGCPAFIVVMGIWSWACVAIWGDALFIENGVFFTFSGVLDLIMLRRSYPRGFQMPDGVDPRDYKQTRAVVWRYRQESRGQRRAV